jgi:hypothetical protein
VEFAARGRTRYVPGTDPVRQLSISKVPPDIRRVRDAWEILRDPHRTKYYGCDTWRKRWATAKEAAKHISSKRKWNVAVSLRSAIVLSLETDVAAGDIPDQWPVVIRSGKQVHFWYL